MAWDDRPEDYMEPLPEAAPIPTEPKPEPPLLLRELKR